MNNINRINFKTPAGLKVRLNHRYFFYQLPGKDINKNYTNDEIVDDEAMSCIVSRIELVYLIPTALLQVFTIIALLMHMKASIFCIIASILYLVGMIFRYFKTCYMVTDIMCILANFYRVTWWIFFAIILVLAFVFDSKYLIIPYIAIRIALAIFVFLQNYVILNITQKKFGIPFNDTEMCAFRVFHDALNSEEKMFDYINRYVAVIYRTEN